MNAGSADLEPLTPTTTRALLESHGLAPRRVAGQNFLVDPNVVDRIVGTAAVAPGDTVLEVGPGLGALTRGLLSVGAHVVAVEIDAGLVRVLQETLGTHPSFELVHADVLHVDLDELLADRGRVSAVANLPYNVATPVLFQLLGCPHVDDALLMVQAEVGERWTASPRDKRFGAVSLKVAALADARVAFRVPPTVFLPAPRIDSVMVAVHRRDRARDAETEWLLTVIDRSFVQPRKTLRNNLVVSHPPQLVDRALQRAGLDPTMRPGRLSLADAERLADALQPARGPMTED